MKPTIVLLSPPDQHRRIVTRLWQAGDYTEDPIFDRLDRGDCRFGVDVSGRVLHDFEEEEREEIRHRIGEARAIGIEYSGAPCIRRLLNDVIQGMSGLLDTNYGELIEYEEVLARFRREPLWDWRSTPAE